MMSSTDQIVKQVEISAPIVRVWQALADYREFGEWFRVKLEVPFVVGKPAYGQITYPGYEHIRMEVQVIAIEPMTRFAFTWHPYAIEPGVDYSHERPTTVEFLLQSVAGGTSVTVTESGFDAVPESRRSEAFRMNEGGWAIQMENIKNYVQQH